MRTYEELRGGHPPRDIHAELLRIGETDRKPKILLNPRTGRKTFEYPLEDGSSPSETNAKLPSKAMPSETA